MKRFLIVAIAALGVLALPGSASAFYNQADCSNYTPGNPNAGAHASAANGKPGTTVAAGACVNVPNPTGFEGGAAEAGVGEDAATGTADPEITSGVGPDAYVIVDGDNANQSAHPQGDGYVGVSNWENGNTRATACGTGNDNGSAGSSNSGGCINNVLVPPVGIPAGAIPTPVCGNTSGNSWHGNNGVGSGNRDGCEVPS